MKFALAALAVVAAVAALVFRPPSLGLAPPKPPASTGDAAAGSLESRLAASRRAALGREAPASRGVVIYVAGEVRRPGVYTVVKTGRAVDALAKAGGALSDADLVAVNLAAPLNDGEEIAVPKIGAAPPREGARQPRSAHRGAARGHRSRRAAAHATPVRRFDLNAAEEAELESVPGVGPALAARIVEYREVNGPFGSTDELADVSGITPRVQDALADHSFVR